MLSQSLQLIGCDEQVQNDLGNYELMICHRDEEPWGANIISRLAHYTLEAKLNPGDTMDIGPLHQRDRPSRLFSTSTTQRLRFSDVEAGLLLCMGITADELAACRTGRREDVEKALRAAKVYPFTDLFRKSVLKK